MHNFLNINIIIIICIINTITIFIFILYLLIFISYIMYVNIIHIQGMIYSEKLIACALLSNYKKKIIPK